MDENRDSCNHFSLNVQATIKYVVSSARLTFPNVGVDGFTGHDGKVMSDKKIFLSLIKGVRVNIEIFAAFLQ